MPVFKESDLLKNSIACMYAYTGLSTLIKVLLNLSYEKSFFTIIVWERDSLKYL